VAEEGRLALDELYLPEQTVQQRLWEGPKLNASDLSADSTYDRVLPASAFDYSALAERVGSGGVYAVDELTIAELVEHALDVKRGRVQLNLLQSIKSAPELAALESAIEITMAALADAIVVALPGAFEFQAEAAIEGGCRRRGAEFLAFPSICGSGPNSCYLHYRANSRRLEDGDLLLMDVGAKVHGYCADFTRTIPVNGRFTPRQREIYTLVYEAQRTAAAALRPGVTMREVHEVAVEFFEKAGLREHFKHGLGHQLGIRVHDVPGFRGALEPGMVVTVEPGLYLVEEELGVRIEDDYLITEDGARKLSDAIPSAPDELEAYIGRLRGRM
jgi:Xaa-Pro aminopeptidase